MDDLPLNSAVRGGLLTLFPLQGDGDVSGVKQRAVCYLSVKDTPSQTPSQLSHRVQQFQHVSTCFNMFPAAWSSFNRSVMLGWKNWPCNAPCCRCCLHTILRPFSSTPLYFATNPARCEVCKSVQRCAKVFENVQDGSKVPHKKRKLLMAGFGVCHCFLCSVFTQHRSRTDAA